MDVITASGMSRVDVSIKEITQKLTEDGLNSQASLEEKLLHLWHLYTESKAGLQATMDNIEDLRQQQAQEMLEVENYVEHIRNLSDEREALTLEFESENEHLKAEVEQLQQELAGYQNEETTEMLVQQGLDDIAHSSTSEQIAYLLVERARLMDELEIEQHRSRSRPGSRADDTNVAQLMEQERKGFEEELKQQRESMQQLKTHLQEVHEKEITKLTEERSKHLEDLDQAAKKINHLQIQLNNLSVELEQEKQSHQHKLKSVEANLKNSAVSEVGQLQDERRKLEGELQASRSQVKDLERNNLAFQESLRELNGRFEHERQENQNKCSQLNHSITELTSTSENDQRQIHDLKSSVRLLAEERNSLREKVESLGGELQTLRQREVDLRTKSESLQKQEHSSNRYKQLYEEAKQENEEALEILNSTQEALKEEIENSANLQEKLTLAEERAEDLNKLDQQSKVLKSQKAAVEEQLQRAELSYQQQIQVEKQRVTNLQSKLDVLKKRLNDQQEEFSEKSESEGRNIQSLESQVAALQQELETRAGVHQTEVGRERSRVRELEGRLAEVEGRYQEEMKSKGKHEKNLQTELDRGSQLQKELEEKVLQLEQDLKMSGLKLQEQVNVKLKLEEQLNRTGSQVQSTKELREQIILLNKAVKQLEAENLELTKKFSETLSRSEDLERRLRNEQEKGHEVKVMLESREGEKVVEVRRLEADVLTLRSELMQRKSVIMKLESDLESRKVEQENEFIKLKNQFEQQQLNHKKELENLGKNLEKVYKDLSDSRNTLRDTEEEMIRLKHQTSVEGRETVHKLELESKLRQDVEKRNRILENELEKVWQQLREKMTHITNLEKARDNLEEELDRKSLSSRNTENRLAQRNMDQSAALQEANRRVEETEARAADLQHELNEALLKMEACEHQMRDGSNFRVDLQRARDESVHLRTQLQDEKLNRKLEAQHTEELKKHMSLLKEKESKLAEQNRELQHMLLDMENKMSKIQDQSRSASSMQSFVENAKQTLAEQVARLQKEIETQQLELLASSERYDNQIRRYEERKARHKNKLQRAREIYNREKCRLRDYIVKLEEELRLSKMALDKELEFKEKTVDDYKMLMKEKRELLTKLTEEEETARDKSRLSSMLQVRCKFLEEENRQLQERLGLLHRQKQDTEKLLKDTQKHREVVQSLTPIPNQTPRSLTPLRSSSPDQPTGVTPHSTLSSTGVGQSMNSTLSSSGVGRSIDSSWDNQHFDILSKERTPKYGLLTRMYNHSSFEELDD